MTTIIHTKTLIRQLEAELRAACPGVQFDFYPFNGRPGRGLSVNWCDGPEYEVVDAIIAKHQDHGVYLLTCRDRSCEQCGTPTVNLTDDDRALCEECDPNYWTRYQ